MATGSRAARPTKPARTSWAGTTLADRRAERRATLLAVGLDLIGAQGSAAVSVRSVCRAARLTDRYFYESFADRDALLLAVFDEVAAEASTALLEAVAGTPDDDELRARAAVEAFLGVITGDPRKGRVLLVEPLTDPTLGVRGVAMAPAFEAIVRAQLAARATARTAQLTATAVIGALAGLFSHWLDGTLDVGREELTDYCVRLLVSVASLAQDPPPHHGS